MGIPVIDYTEDLHPRDPTGKWTTGSGSTSTQLARLQAARAKKVDNTPPVVRSTTLSLLRDAGGLSAALDAIKDYPDYDNLIDPETKLPVPAIRVRNALEALRPPPLPKNEEYVTVHHATDPATAAMLLKDGLIPELKPNTLAAERYEKGEAATFAPGAGLSRGTYVAEPGRAESYGRTVLELKIPKSYLEVPPEQESLGVSDPVESLKTHDGAVITKPIPPEAIRDLAAPRAVTFETTLPPEIHVPAAAELTRLVTNYPELEGLRVTDGAPAGTLAIKGGGRILINPDEWSDPVKLAAHEKAWKGLVVDSSPIGVLVHEAGHVVDGVVSNRLGSDEYTRIVQKHFPEVWTQTDGGIRASVSIFGQENSSEFMAETFSAMHFNHHEMGRDPEAERWLDTAKTMWAELLETSRRSP